MHAQWLGKSINAKNTICILILVVKRKGLSAAFLPKISAEIRQKDFLIRNALSAFLQKEAVSAERGSFCRNSLFLQHNCLKMRYKTAIRGT